MSSIGGVPMHTCVCVSVCLCKIMAISKDVNNLRGGRWIMEELDKARERLK